MEDLPDLPKPLCTVRLDRIGGAVDVAACEQDAEMWVHGVESVHTDEAMRSYGLQCYRMGVEAERERAVPVLIPIALEKAMDLADAYVVAATGDTATARHKVSSARAALRAHLKGWGRLAESQQALEEMGKRIKEISARYGLGESAAAIRGTDTE